MPLLRLPGDLPAKAVVHTVGPVWRGGEQNEDQLLQDAYLNSLRLVAANSYTSVLFLQSVLGFMVIPVRQRLKSQ